MSEPIPSYMMTDDKRGAHTATIYTVTVLATVFVGLRFLARFKRKAIFGIDDWTLIVSLVGRNAVSIELQTVANARL